jgi:hypothetical protein
VCVPHGAATRTPACAAIVERSLVQHTLVQSGELAGGQGCCCAGLWLLVGSWSMLHVVLLPCRTAPQAAQLSV